jgi:hypothetical protein
MRSLRHLASIGLAVAALSPEVAARQAGRQTVHIGIELGGPPPPAVRRIPAMIGEADAVWRPRGVSVSLVDAGQIPRGDVRITLTFASLAGADAGRGAQNAGDGVAGLGSIWFDADGTPVDAITIDERAVAARLADVKLNGRPIDDWPPAVVDQVAARALGRVLAHELGHYLLASKTHASSGLMRAGFSGAELAAWDRGRFALDTGALPRLRARLARFETARSPVVASTKTAASKP